jgi:hypothetical protein
MDRCILVERERLALAGNGGSRGGRSRANEPE